MADVVKGLSRDKVQNQKHVNNNWPIRSRNSTALWGNKYKIINYYFVCYSWTAVNRKWIKIPKLLRRECHLLLVPRPHPQLHHRTHPAPGVCVCVCLCCKTHFWGVEVWPPVAMMSSVYKVKEADWFPRCVQSCHSGERFRRVSDPNRRCSCHRCYCSAWLRPHTIRPLLHTCTGTICQVIGRIVQAIIFSLISNWTVD